jgi:hypothetical protein
MRIRRHVSFANVVSMLALFIALGGTSYALATNSVGHKAIKKNAVRASEIKTRAVGASEIRSNAVAGGDVADGSIGSLDLGDDSVGSGELAADSVGNGEMADNSVGSAEVIDGSLGENDLQPGLLDFGPVTVQRTDVALPDNSTVGVEATCPAGQVAIGGGASVDETSSDDIKLMVSRPGNGGLIPADGQQFANTWRAVYRNPQNGTLAATIRAFVLCVEQ